MKITNARIFWNIIWLLASIVLVWIWFPMLWILLIINSIIYFFILMDDNTFEEDFIKAGIAILSFTFVVILIVILFQLLIEGIIKLNKWLNRPKKQKPSYPPIDKGERHKA